jgi:S1-C subfamily serine protease
MAKIQFRHNAMEINSIDAFLGIRGGFHNGTRDVYFVRGVGEPKNLAEQIRDIDKKMDIEMASGKLKYVRISRLPQLREIKDSDFYSAVYTRWTEGEVCALNKINPSTELNDVLKDAFENTIEEYKKTKDNVTTSMIRNFATKILYWFDQCVGELLSTWSERMCVKVLADNVVRDQEFLFYLFLTYLGCDVLLIENREDIVTAERIVNYSRKIELGHIGESVLEPYAKYVPEKETSTSPRKQTDNVAGGTAQSVKVVIPERPSRQKNTYSSNTQPVVVPEQQTHRKSTNSAGALSNAKQEKSFEELALLASSVVLIAIHDSDGDIIGTGSGIMIGKNGFILTNNHVASGGRFYSVRIEDDEEVYVTDEIIKYNATTDLAVIRIQRQLNPIPVYKGKKKLVRGQKVVAIGSPLGLFNSVSDGIISGFRNIHDIDMIQFTAPISHGSSGGAVLNMQGEVIGISTAGIDDGQNINLAVGYESIWQFASGFMN